MQTNKDGTVTVRIRETGQVLDMVPGPAREMLASGYAEDPSRPECAAVEPRAEKAVTPAQAGPTKKSMFRRGKN
jgi:hypothetical protein